MFNLHLQTFLIVVEILTVVYLITTLFIYVVRRHRIHLLFAYALLCSLLAIVLIHFSLDGPTTLVIVMYNVLIQSTMMLLITGYRSYYQKNSFSYRYLLYILVNGLLIWMFTEPFHSYTGRVCVSILTLILFIADGVFETLKNIKNEIKPLRYSVLAVMLVLIFGFSVRLITTIITNPQLDLMESMASTAYFGGFVVIIVFSFWISCSLLLETNSSMTMLKSKSQTMEELAMLDPLTKLSNRNRLETDMQYYIEVGNRTGIDTSLLMIDLDHFKEINDVYGHDVGDKVLTSAAEVITSLLRSDDRVYRWGGDEFLILASHTDLSGASHLAQRIIDQLTKVNFIENKTMTASIGCAQHFRNENKEDWFKRVDLALYKAKQAGRNRFEAWPNTEKLPLTITRLVWNDSLNSGIDNLDFQHKALLNLSNELYERLISSDSVANLDYILDQVLVELREHFIYESRLMKEKDYPAADNHAKIHNKLLNDYDQLRLHLKTGETNLSSFFNFITVKIIAEHITKEDTKFFEFYKTL